MIFVGLFRLFQKNVYKNMVTLYKNLGWYNGNKDFVLQYGNEKIKS